MKQLFSVVLLLVIGVSLSVHAQTESDDTCTLPANYNEANRENNINLLRLYGFLGNDGVLDREAENATLYFSQMQSIRQYYEDQAATLPDCAQPLNTVYIRVVTAMQDVLAYNIAIAANPQRADSITRDADRARQHLNEATEALSGNFTGSLFDTE